MAIGAMQGAMFAAKFRDRRIDLVGVVLIGTFTGLGGSFLRDCLLNGTPAALGNNWYLTTALIASLLGMTLERLVAQLDPLVIALDALTVGLYAAVGSVKALGSGMPTVPAVFVGVIAAVGGSALRDIFLAAPIALMQVGSFYAVAATAGAVTVPIVFGAGGSALLATGICVVVTTVVRLCAVRFGWTLPEQRALQLGRE